MNGRSSAQRQCAQHDLTQTELEFLRLVANGYNVEKIAEHARMYVKDVREALTSAQIKLGANNALQAVSQALRTGLIGMERL